MEVPSIRTVGDPSNGTSITLNPDTGRPATARGTPADPAGAPAYTVATADQDDIRLRETQVPLLESAAGCCLAPHAQPVCFPRFLWDPRTSEPDPQRHFSERRVLASDVIRITFRGGSVCHCLDLVAPPQAQVVVEAEHVPIVCDHHHYLWQSCA
jgi:hypothetical protein